MNDQLGFVKMPDPRPVRKMSATQRRTARNNAMLQQGIHPATKKRLRIPLDGEKTCGECRHLLSHRTNRTWYKCGLVPVTFGAATDIRLSWPACIEWEPDDA